MVVMDLKMDNFCAFKDFDINFSYPKKVVHSYLENEFLSGHPNFRYKRVNVIMGSNATGKTSLGKMLMSIFGFINRQNVEQLLEKIDDRTRKASFSIDFVPNKKELYRVEAVFAGSENEDGVTADCEELHISKAKIGNNDSYESCLKKLAEIKAEGTYMERLKKVPPFGWFFTYPRDAFPKSGMLRKPDRERYLQILEYILRTLDPSIMSVEKSKEVSNSYIIHFRGKDLFIQDGEVVKENILSSGTSYGIDIADIVTAVLGHENGFYYCDEKFSYINSLIETTILSIMINALGDDEQLFFTTHNADVLDIGLPKHSFSFLKKEQGEEDTIIKCLYASDYLKRNTDSLRCAVENDLFSIAPDLELLYELQNPSSYAKG